MPRRSKKPGTLHTFRLPLLFWGLGGSALVCAETPPAAVNILDPLVVTGTYAPVSSFDLPFSIDTVTHAQINDGQLGVTLSEALSRVPGLVVQNRQN